MVPAGQGDVYENAQTSWNSRHPQHAVVTPWRAAPFIDARLLASRNVGRALYTLFGLGSGLIVPAFNISGATSSLFTATA